MQPTAARISLNKKRGKGVADTKIRLALKKVVTMRTTTTAASSVLHTEHRTLDWGIANTAINYTLTLRTNQSGKISIGGEIKAALHYASDRVPLSNRQSLA